MSGYHLTDFEGPSTEKHAPLFAAEGNLRARLQYAAMLLSMLSHADLSAAAWIWYDAKGNVCTAPHGKTYSIGRNPLSSIHIPDLRVSRSHAFVDYNETGWQLRKISLNGSVCVNGRPIDTAFLVY